MRLILPFPPSVNAYWRHVPFNTKRGLITRVLISKRGREYRTEALLAIRQQYPVHEVIDYKVKVKLLLFPRTNRKYDVDNFNKAPLDALTHAKIWTDDELVYDMHCIKREKHAEGAVIVSIDPL